MNAEEVVQAGAEAASQISTIDIITIVLSVLSLLITVFIAIKQFKQDKRLAVFDKRYEAILKVQKDELLDVLQVKLLFPKCVDAYEKWTKARQKISGIEADISDYLDTYAGGYNQRIEDVLMGFQLAEIGAEECGDDSYKEYCDKRAITYTPPGYSDPVTRNYYDMCEEKTAAERECESVKEKLINAMKKMVK